MMYSYSSAKLMSRERGMSPYCLVAGTVFVNHRKRIVSCFSPPPHQQNFVGAFIDGFSLIKE